MTNKSLHIPHLALRCGRHTGSLGPFSRLGHTSTINLRTFHATSRRPFVDQGLVLTHTFMSGLHDLTGLPWAASIPLTAFFVRAFILFTLSFYHRRISQSRLDLAPQIEKYKSQAQKQVDQRSTGKSAPEEEALVNAQISRMTKMLHKENGVQSWKTLILAIPKFPIWLAVMETLRNMAGVQEGIPGLVGESLGTNSNTGFSDLSPIPTEQSFIVEGMLWFPNLLQPDPALILSFLMSGTLLLSSRGTSFIGNVAWGSGRAIEMARMFNGTRFKRVLALVAGPATLQFPSAMLLYMISNNIFQIGEDAIKTRWMPLKIPTTSEMPGRVSKPGAKKQQFRGPTMKELRNRDKKK